MPDREGPSSLQVVQTVLDLRALAESWRRQRLRVGLVPTMGALHRGHVQLARRAREECSRVIVSIFVNPLQFAAGEDLDRYPRPLDADLRLLEAERVDLAFLPAVEEMYPNGEGTRVRVPDLDGILEGAHRPGHFEGVATVVLKLLLAAEPHRAYFGRKDAQQLAVVRRLASDLLTGVEIVGCPTVREPDGLALSSRNRYLEGADRAAATCLSQALLAANAAYLDGERDSAALRERLWEVLGREPRADVDYAEVVDEGTFQAPGRLAVIAARIGGTRLIDNHLLGEPFP
ncbi:MAG TPA: pantoate--beta-alanine ligase [Candidatus Dormibacteraeota bacterium]|nr:pantoate--beta-alanine ligase [Candidatus Dormibacteraeota bacterium]